MRRQSPDPLTISTVDALTENSILSWNAVPGAATYTMWGYEPDEPDAPPHLLGFVTAPATSYNINGDDEFTGMVVYITANDVGGREIAKSVNETGLIENINDIPTGRPEINDMAPQWVTCSPSRSALWWMVTACARIVPRSSSGRGSAPRMAKPGRSSPRDPPIRSPRRTRMPDISSGAWPTTRTGETSTRSSPLCRRRGSAPPIRAGAVTVEMAATVAEPSRAAHHHADRRLHQCDRTRRERYDRPRSDGCSDLERHHQRVR
jgi:hypothetical protein